MSDLDQDFHKAANDVANLKTRPNDEDLLHIYGLFKQATVGDCDQPKPGIFHMKERAKHELWAKMKGKTRDEAKRAYIDKVNSMIASYGLK